MRLVKELRHERRSRFHGHGHVLLTTGDQLAYTDFGGDFEIEWVPGQSPDVPAVALAREVAGLVRKDTWVRYWGLKNKSPGVWAYASPEEPDEIGLLLQFHPAVSDEETSAYATRYLRRHGLHMRQAIPQSDGDGTWWELTCTTPDDGPRTMRELLDTAASLQRSTVKPLGIAIDSVDGALQALADGELWRFIGLRENEWLEVKSQLPDLSKTAGRFTLAKDVAQFANSRTGGVLAYGFFTKNKGHGDVVQKVSAIAVDRRLLQSVEAVLRGNIHPAISGLHIGSVPIDGGNVLYIHVPGQLDAAKPFIVEGAGISELGKGSVFAIPVRHGDAAVPVTGRSLHALLAGRVRLSG
ncbi:ATP-binding protein [Streptomyces thermolilacinus]